MLREFNRVLTIALLAIPTLAFAGPPPGSGYDKLVLDENFDKPIGTPESFWNVGNWLRLGSDPQVDGYELRNNKLWLKAYTEPGRKHRVGYVCTRGKFERRYALHRSQDQIQESSWFEWSILVAIIG